MINNIESAWRYPIVIIIGILVGGYIGAMIATIYAMLVFREDLNSIDPLEPWFLRYDWDFLTQNSEVLQTILLLNGVVIVGMVMLGVSGVYRGRLTRYDQSHFQTRRELKRNKMLLDLDENGFIYGKTGKPASEASFVGSHTDRFPHALLVAPTGRGKTAGFAIPNLLHFQGSAVVLDVKGQIFEATSIHRQKGMDNTIWYFSPFDYRDGEGRAGQGAAVRTHCYNPLSRIANLPSMEQQYTAINTLTDLLLVPHGEQARGFFETAKPLFIASCLYAIEKGNGTIAHAAQLLGGGGERAKNYRAYADDSKNPVVQRIFREMAGEQPKHLDIYRSVLNGAGLQLWNDPAVIRATQRSDFDFRSFRKNPQSLYIVVQPEHLQTLAPLIRLLFADAIASLQHNEPGPDEPHKVMFLMDEFDQLGRQPIVLKSLKTIRSYGGRYFIMSQSVAGLENPDLYGTAGRQELQAAAGLQIYMTPNDERTAEVISTALGKKTIVSKTESHSAIREIDDSANISRRAEERPLVTPNELLRFPLDKVIVLPEGQYPILCDHIRFFEDHHFAPIYKAREGHPYPYPPLTDLRSGKVPTLSTITKGTTDDQAEFAFGKADRVKTIGNCARKAPRRKRAEASARQEKTSETIRNAVNRV